MAKVSLAIVDNACAAYLAGPTRVTLTTSWQRFRIERTLANGQTGLWIVVRHYAANGDDWITGGADDGYRFADLGAANNPSGWAGVLKVKTTAGTTLGYILLYSTP